MRSWRETFEKVERKLLVGAIIALTLLAIAGISSVRDARQLIAVNAQLNKIHATIADEEELVARLNQAETGLFGYILTGQTNYLTPYLTATSSIPALVARVHSGIEGHPDAAADLQPLESLIDQRLGQMRQRLEAYASGGADAAVATIKSGEAKSLMDRVRSLISSLTEHEIARLHEMEEQAVRSAHNTIIVGVTFGTLSVATLATILAWLMRENVSRKGTEAELREAGRALEMRVAQRTADLASANASLQNEIAEHKRAEEALRASEQKLNEAARALADKNKDLEMLIYVASHDLRGPLLNIRGFVAELMRGCAEVQSLIARTDGASLPKEQTARLLDDMPESAGFIQAGVMKMDALLGGFLRLSRLGRAAIKVSRVDMNALMQNVVQSFAFQLREAGAEVVVDRLPRCSADSTQLAQVFSNLIDNAVKYRDPARPLRVQISAETRNGMVAFRVADNGLGIPADHRDRVFEIFHRVNPAESEGEGLGLTIARRILDRVGGRVELEAMSGGGCTFTVWVPSGEREAQGAATQ